VSDLDDVVDLLQRRGSGFRTLRATVVVRRDDDLVIEAHCRAAEEAERRGMRTLTVSVGFDGPPKEGPRESTETTRLWFEPPKRIRAETEGRRSSTLVMDGRHELRSSFLGQEIVRGPLRSPYDVVTPLFLLRPWALLLDYLFEPLGGTELAGRAAVEVRARLRPGDGTRVQHVRGFSWGADEHRLAIDRERGVLLRVGAVMDGQEYEATEMTEIAFDEPIEPDVFRLEAPPGVETITAEESVRRLRATFPHPRHGKNGLERMARQADFVLFAPPRDGHPITGSKTTFHEDCVSATFTQLWGDESHSVEIVLRPHTGPPTTSLTVFESPDGNPAVRTIRDGTSIEVSSATLGNKRLLELVSTLEPVVPAED
jgi:hypothetical protein